MIRFARFTLVGAVLAVVAAPLSAQDWLTSPAPAIPLHVPIAPPIASPPPPALPTAPPSAPSVAPNYPDAVQRLLDPYNLSRRPTATSPPPPLPSIAFAPTGPWAAFPRLDPNGVWQRADPFGPRLTVPPLVAFPNIPIAWLLGF